MFLFVGLLDGACFFSKRGNFPTRQHFVLNVLVYICSFASCQSNF